MFKKFIVVLLTLTVLLSLGSIAAFAATPAEEGYTNLYDVDDQTPTDVPLGKTVGVRFHAASAFSAFSILMADYAPASPITNVTVKMFKWDTDLMTTISKTEIEKKAFAPIENNGWHTLTFDSKEAGEYVVTVTHDSADSNAKLAMWSSKGTTDNIISYNEKGQALTGITYKCAIKFDTAPAGDKFLPLYDNGVQVGYKTSAFRTYVKKAADSVEPTDNQDIRTPIQFKDGNFSQLGYRFNSKVEFAGLQAACPTWTNNKSGVTLKLYKWEGNYQNTVAGKAIATQKIENIVEPATSDLSFAIQPAGEYLLLLCEPVETVGIYQYATADFPDVKCYVDGTVTEGKVFDVSLVYVGATKTYSEIFGALSADTNADNNKGNVQTSDVNVIMIASVVAMVMAASVVFRKKQIMQ